jgi:hypothetical protein
MGFSDKDGELRQLIRTAGGNIGKVLDVLEKQN